MKKPIMALIVVAALAAGVSFGAARWLRCRACAMPTAANLHDAGWLKRELKLSDTQAAAIAKLETEFNDRLSDCCGAHCAARFALSRELAKPSVDQTVANACVQRMCAAAADGEQATLDHILRVRSLLNADQQKRYAERLGQQLCACPMNRHQP